MGKSREGVSKCGMGVGMWIVRVIGKDHTDSNIWAKFWWKWRREPHQYLEKSFPVRENPKCQGPEEEGACWASSRQSKEGHVAGTGGKQDRWLPAPHRRLVCFVAVIAIYLFVCLFFPLGRFEQNSDIIWWMSAKDYSGFCVANINRWYGGKLRVYCNNPGETWRGPDTGWE